MTNTESQYLVGIRSSTDKELLKFNEEESNTEMEGEPDPLG